MSDNLDPDDLRKIYEDIINSLPKIKDYDIVNKDGSNIKLINKYNNIKTINNENFTKSKMIKCIINKKDDIISDDKNNYASTLTDVYNNCSYEYLYTKYFNKTSHKFDTDKKLEKYIWNKKHEFAYRGKNSNAVIKEIVDIVKENEFSMLLHIKLENGKELKYKL